MVKLKVSDSLFSEVREAVAKHQPELTVTRGEKIVLLKGLFVLSGPTGPFDSYKIATGVPAGFPVEEPVVWEKGGRIPRIADRHINLANGDCCLGIWEEWLLTGQDHSFETFLTGPLHDYFVSQAYYEAHGVWPFGERSHGKQGILEAYADLLGLPADEKLLADYVYILSRETIKGHAMCPCGSGKRVRRCHNEELQVLSQKIPPDIAKRMYRTISPKKVV